jgi:hypothetical protein
MNTVDSEMSSIDVEKLDKLLDKIRKHPNYVYTQQHINHLFDLSNDKPWVIEVLLSTREYNENNYINSMADIVLYYETKNMIDEFKQILKKIGSSMEFNKTDNYNYYNTDKHPSVVLFGDDQQRRKTKRIIELMKLFK